MNAYVFSPPEPDFDFWSVMGQHHPVWFRDAKRRSPSRWLQQVLSGEDPGGWFQGGWTPILKEVAAAPGPETASGYTDPRKNDPVHPAWVGMFQTYWPELRSLGTAGRR